MRIKTYCAKSMGEALREIKAELGPEALILSTKEVPCRSEVGRRSSVEVVAAIETGGDEFHQVSDTVALTAAGRSAVPLSQLAPGLQLGTSGVYTPAGLTSGRSARRRRTVRGSGRSRGPAPARISPAPLAPPFADAISTGVYRDLLARGVEDWLACRLLRSARELQSSRRWRSRSGLLQSLRQVVGCAVEASPASGLPGRRVVVFFGPTGVGKTTTIAKLAARLALAQRKKVMLMTVDGSRIGAVGQLKTYASLMGIPFRFVNRLSELSAAVREQSQRDFVLIDTAGFNPRDAETLRDLAAFLRETTPVERHLVLSATTSPADTRMIIERFKPCSPDYLLFTKIDEAANPGPILNELVRSRTPASYYTDGQRVPQDLHAMDKERILDIVLNSN